LIVRLGGQLVALATGAGGQVVEIESCTRVPTGPDYLVGVGNGQGTLLVLVDIRPLLGLPAGPWSWPLLAQIVGEDRMRLAFAVEEVLGLGELAALQAAQPEADLPGDLRTYCWGTLDTPAGRAVVLDVARVVQALRAARN
jgi:chemotaxis signal transduction protein